MIAQRRIPHNEEAMFYVAFGPMPLCEDDNLTSATPEG